MAFRISIIENSFDSLFQSARPGEPAKLTIRLRMVLHPQDPAKALGAVYLAASPDVAARQRGRVADANGRLLRCRGWSVKAWNEFRDRFKWVAELVWNNQMILLPPDAEKGPDGLADDDYRRLIDKNNPQLPAHVRCALEVQLASTNAELTPGGWQAFGHGMMNVANVDEDEPQKFRSHSRLISNRAVRFSDHSDNERWPGIPIIQFAAAHEVGHWLGYWENNTKLHWFNHIEYDTCSKLPGHQANNDCEYGRTLGTRLGIMGSGGAATEYDASPWLTRIRRHTHALLGWSMMHRIRFKRGEASVSERQKRLVAAGLP